jgi:hypothetical protein
LAAGSVAGLSLLPGVGGGVFVSSGGIDSLNGALVPLPLAYSKIALKLRGNR